MSKIDFAKLIISQLESAIGKDGSGFAESSSTTAMSAIADAITSYLINNVTVTISYSGILPPPASTPDPVVTDIFKITGECTPVSVSDSFTSWLAQIEANIISGFTLQPKGENGIIFSQQPFINPGIALTQMDIMSAHLGNENNPQQVVWELICEKIITWLETIAINVTPGPSSNSLSSSTGIAYITAINIT